MLDIIHAAGWPIWPLLAASVLALALIIERTLALRGARLFPAHLERDVQEMLRRRQDTPEALNRLAATSLHGWVLAEVLRQRGLPQDERREAVEEAGREAVYRMSRFLPALGTIAVVAPLMGLFGTIVGMIEIFGAYQPGGTDPARLAHGISVALYNTGLGILIAIPALIAHRTLRARVDVHTHRLEQSAARVLRLLRQPVAETAP